MRLVLALTLATAAAGFAAPAFADCGEDIKAVMTLATSSGPYRMETQVKAASGDMTMTGEMVPPAAIRTKTVIGGMTQEMVFVDGRGWMNTAGSWSELPAEVAGQMSAAVKATGPDMLAGITAPQCLGTQSVDGRDYLAFSFDYAVSGINTSTTIYADPATRRPAKLVSSSEVAGQKTETAITYTYDPAIRITAPL